MVKDEEIDGAPSSAKIIRNCCAAVIPPNPPTEYETIAEGLKKYSSKNSPMYFLMQMRYCDYIQELQECIHQLL